MNSWMHAQQPLPLRLPVCSGLPPALLGRRLEEGRERMLSIACLYSAVPVVLQKEVPGS